LMTPTITASACVWRADVSVVWRAVVTLRA
jgi:hypothetical protein